MEKLCVQSFAAEWRTIYYTWNDCEKDLECETLYGKVWKAFFNFQRYLQNWKKLKYIPYLKKCSKINNDKDWTSED